MGQRPLGFATVTVLHAVARGTVYGFDICDETGLPSGTVYPALGKLEQAGFLRSSWEAARLAQREKRPPRRYYEVTAAGQRVLAEALTRFHALEPIAAPRTLKPAKARG